MKKVKVYLDYHSTTPIDRRVLEKMTPFLTERFGNPSNKFHSFGWEAEQAVEDARKMIASHLNADPSEIIFTSGSTESNNTAIKGIASYYRDTGNHIITCATEHKSVLETCRLLEKKGSRITYIPVNERGIVDTKLIREAITGETILITFMTANNEIGTLQPIAEIGKIAREHNVFFHTDATQAAGKIKIDVQNENIDLLSLSGHKIYGPKGTGILYVRSRNPLLRLDPLIAGGGQEFNLRGGTHNVPGIVGIAAALDLCEELRPVEMPEMKRLSDLLWKGLCSSIEEISLNGSAEFRIPNNLNISFRGIVSSELMMLTDDLALSAGSACVGKQIEPSYVLRALNIPKEDMYSAIRFGIGRFTTESDIYYAVDRISETVELLRRKVRKN